MTHQSDKLLLRQTSSNSQTDIYLADDELTLDSNLGRLFIIMEIFSREKKTKDLIKQIITNIEADYYSSPTSDPESSLETACQNFNSYFPDLINKPKTWLSKFNILVGAVKEDEIFLTSHGNFKTALIRDNKFVNIIPEEEIKKPSNKMLTQLISGKIESRDIFVFSNATLFDYFSREKIKKTISSLNAAQSIEYFKNLLLENTNPVSFSAVIFKFNDIKETIESNQKEYLLEFYGTKESMNNLINMERKTTKVLRANLLPNLKKLLELPHKLFSNKKTGIKMPEIKKTIALKKTMLDLQGFINRIKNLPHNFTARLRTLNKKHKTIGIIFLALIIIFIGSLFVVNKSKEIKQTQANFTNQVNIIKDKISESKAALIYQDEKLAENNLKEARLLLDSLPQEKTEQINTFKNLDNEIQVAFDEIYHIYQTTPELLIDLTQISSDDKILDLIKNPSRNNLFALTKNNLLYSINPVEKSYTQNSDKANYIKMRNWDNDNLIFLAQNNKFTTYNIPNNSFSVKPTDFSAYTISAWNIYGNKIYLADTEQKQIFKISNPLSPAPQITKWYNDDPLILEKVNNLIIDGDIWLTTNNSDIYQIFRGQNQHFEIKNLNKSLGSGIEIYTEIDWQKLYILDKDNSRIIILTKGGMVEKQLKNNLFNNCTNLNINNNQTFVWLNCENKIMQVEL